MAYNSKPKFDKFKQEENKDYYQIMTDKIIEKMKESVQYQKPWISTNTLPYNPITKTKYSGSNLLFLLMAGYDDPRFFTYNNIQSIAKETGENVHVRKGEKGIPIFKAIQRHIENKDDATGEDKSFSLWTQVYSGTVFNASQIENLPPRADLPKADFEGNKELDTIQELLIKDGLKVEELSIDKAYYSPTEDAVRIPSKELFKSENLYRRTKLHEFVHATGGKNRLNRDQSGSFGSQDYAYEELVAELGSYFLGGHIGIDYSADETTHANHAAYLNSWIKTLQEDKKVIWRASTAAGKAMDYVINLKNELTKENTEEAEVKSKIKP